MTATRRTSATPRSQTQKTTGEGGGTPEDTEPLSITRERAPAPKDEPVEKLGDILKRVREKRGDDLQQIADYLCIRRNFLEALEANRYEDFPADAYVIGFLRSYANYLGLDGREAIDRYRSEMAGRRRKPALQVPMPITEGRTPSAILMIGAAVGALLIYVLWYSLSSSDRSVVSTPPPLPVAAATAPETPATTAAASAAAPSAGPSSALVVPPTQAKEATASASAQALPAGEVFGDTTKTARLTIKAEQSSWILISDTEGHTVFDRVMKPGEVYNVPDTRNLLLTTGNGSGVILTLDGVELPRLSVGSSHVIRNISLNPERLKALPQSPEN